MVSKTVVPCNNWINPGISPHAVLLCVHGLGLHGGFYRTFGETMCRRGVATYALDVRGFGGWNKEGSCSLNLSACLKDIECTIAELKHRHPGLPVFLLGESLGGAIATRYAAQSRQDELDGLILSEPARSISDHKLAVLKVLWSLITTPGQSINLSDVITRHALRLVASEEEQIVRLHFSVGELLHLSRFLSGAFKSASRVRVPVLMLQGHSDRLINTRNTLRYFERLGSQQKDLLVLGDKEHLIFQTHEPPDKVVALVADWIGEFGQTAFELQAV